MLWKLFVSFLFLSAACHAQLAISDIRVEGNSRLPAAGIISASGLRAGSTIAKSDLDTAGQKLFATGLFTGFNYRYTPKPGAAPPSYIVTLIVTEDRAQTRVVIDIPNYSEDQLWSELRSANPLIDNVIPDSDAAGNYYARAIEAILAKAGRQETVVMQPEADLTTHAGLAVFQPANLPKVAAIHFEGNKTIRSDALTKIVAPLTIGKDFSPREFDEIVKLNLMPLFEEKGLLTVSYTVKSTAGPAGSVSVDIPIVEGRAWTLGRVDVTGDDLPVHDMLKAANFSTGRPTDWVKVRAGIDEMEKLLRRQGYLQATLRPTRSLHDDTGVVDLTVAVSKGRQSFLGSVQMTGLDPANLGRARKAWSLKSGAPLDYYYVHEEYIKSLKLAGPPRRVSVELKPQGGASVVDVAITFR